MILYLQLYPKEIHWTQQAVSSDGPSVHGDTATATATATVVEREGNTVTDIYAEIQKQYGNTVLTIICVCAEYYPLHCFVRYSLSLCVCLCVVKLSITYTHKYLLCSNGLYAVISIRLTGLHQCCN